jgi:RNA polymerase sigma factor (TIGR02999 family)
MVGAVHPDDEAGAALETDALFGQVYERLKAMAGRRLAGRDRHTLDTTSVVHELYLRIGAGRDLTFAHPEQFFAYAARAMRHLLADRARDRLRHRAGGDWVRTTLTGSDWRLALESAEQTLELDEALQRLEALDVRAARVVELICFAGLDQDRAAEVLGVARRTVARDWRFARAFLKSELGDGT